MRPLTGVESVEISRHKRVLLTPRVIHGLTDVILGEGQMQSRIGDIPSAKELYAPQIILRDPNDRLVTDRTRKMNVAYAVASVVAAFWDFDDEWLMQFATDPSSGYHEDENLWAKSSSWWFSPTTNIRGQFRDAIDELQYTGGSYTIPLSVSSIPFDATFDARERAINCVISAVYIDAIRDLPYMIFLAGAIQEALAAKLKQPTGIMTIVPTSIFIRDTDFASVNKSARRRWPFKMNPWPTNFSDAAIDMFGSLMESITVSTFMEQLNRPIWYREDGGFAFLANYACVLRAWVVREKLPGEVQKAHDRLHDATLKTVLRPWLIEDGLIRGPRPSAEAYTDFEEIE